MSTPHEKPPTPASPRLSEEQELRRRVKRELRKRAQSLRKATPAQACMARSSQIIERLMAIEALREARSVALFWPMEARHEVDLRPVDRALRARGVRVAYPAIRRGAEPAPGSPTSEHDAPSMTFHFVDDVATLEERGSGFEEPSPDAPALAVDLHDLDVVVVPALAVDPSGHRIGYGAGYYDRALAGTAVAKVAVIFDFQLLSEIPTTLGDVPVDWVVTDRRVLEVSPPDATVEGGVEMPWPS